MSVRDARGSFDRSSLEDLMRQIANQLLRTAELCRRQEATNQLVKNYAVTLAVSEDALRADGIDI